MLWKRGANPTNVSYNAGAVKLYNATSSVVHFENKHIFTKEKRSTLLQRWRWSCKSRSRTGFAPDTVMYYIYTALCKLCTHVFCNPIWLEPCCAHYIHVVEYYKCKLFWRMDPWSLDSDYVSFCVIWVDCWRLQNSIKRQCQSQPSKMGIFHNFTGRCGLATLNK
jgi:hypothetical protein